MTTKLEEIVDTYCCDAFGVCTSECERCKKLLKSDLEELVKGTREKVIEEFVSKYKDWSKEPCNNYSRGDDDMCQGICIDCFIRETGLLKEIEE